MGKITKCLKSVTTDMAHQVIVPPSGHVAHGSDTKKIAQLRLTDSLRQRSRAEGTAPAVIFDEEIRRYYLVFYNSKIRDMVSVLIR